jgi:regulator of nonsense transcripts 2
MAPPSRAQLAALAPDIREKEDSARVARQRPVLRVCAELALVGVIRDGPNRSGGEWIMKALKELVRCSLPGVAHIRLDAERLLALK